MPTKFRSRIEFAATHRLSQASTPAAFRCRPPGEITGLHNYIPPPETPLSPSLPSFVFCVSQELVLAPLFRESASGWEGDTSIYGLLTRRQKILCQRLLWIHYLAVPYLLRNTGLRFMHSWGAYVLFIISFLWTTSVQLCPKDLVNGLTTSNASRNN